MNITKKTFRLFALLSMLIAAVGGVLIFLAFYSEYDLSIRHFEVSSTLSVAAGCAVAVGVLCAIAAAIILSKKACPPRRPDSSAATMFLSVFTGCLIIGNAAVSVIFRESALSVLAVICGILATFSGMYMIISPFRLSKGKSAVMLLSLAPSLWMGFSVISAYRVTDTAMNDPFNTYYALVLISLLLYFTSSVGVALSPGSRRGFYTFSSYLLLSVGGAAILSRLILSLVQKSAFNVSVLESIMFLALYVYAAIGVFSQEATDVDKCDSAEAECDSVEAETEDEPENESGAETSTESGAKDDE